MEILLALLKLGLLGIGCALWGIWALMGVIPRGHILGAMVLFVVIIGSGKPEATNLGLIFVGLVAPLIAMRLWLELESYKISQRIQRMDLATSYALRYMLAEELEVRFQKSEAHWKKRGITHGSEEAALEHGRLKAVLLGRPSASLLLDTFKVDGRSDLVRWSNWLTQAEGSENHTLIADQ